MGCGKTTVLRSIIGLKEPAQGQVLVDNRSIWDTGEAERDEIKRNMGVLFQQGALWSSMTLAENIALALELYTDIPATDIREVCSLKLALVGLSGFEDFYPNEISGGMRKTRWPGPAQWRSTPTYCVLMSRRPASTPLARSYWMI